MPFVAKLKNTTQDWRTARQLHFLSEWESPISDEDLEDLTQFGKLEATTLGVDIGQRYRKLKTPQKVWASTAERTRISAQSLISGLDKSGNTTKLVQIYEGEEDGADSLTPYDSCPNYSSSAGSDQSSEFQDKYTAPIIAKFNSWAPKFNFTTDDIVGMQELCGYETVIRGSSPFCSLSLFTPDDWLAFEYANDIMYHYNTGYGSETAAAIGFPWVNATMQKLFDSVNSTVTVTNPISNVTGNTTTQSQDLYISFTHRELPPTVLVALGLFNNSAYSGANQPNSTMPLSVINYQRVWKSSHFLQFLTNVAIEKLECDSYGYTAGEYYRVLVNSAPQSLGADCADGPGTTCSRASMETFIEGRGKMFGDFSQTCGVDYSNSTDILSIYGSS